MKRMMQFVTSTTTRLKDEAVKQHPSHGSFYKHQHKWMQENKNKMAEIKRMHE